MDANDFHKFYDDDATRESFDNAEPFDDPPPAGKFKLIMFRDVDPDPVKEWLVKDFLGVGELSFPYGAPGASKSVLWLDLGCHVAAGELWLGRKVKKGAVLFVAAERKGVTLRRIAAWRKHHCIDDIPLAVISGVIDMRTNELDTKEIIGAAQQLARETGENVMLIIIDTLSRVLAGGDENTSKDIGAVLANVQRIQEATGAHISLVHHVPVYDQQRMRGHGSSLGNADTTVLVSKEADHRAAELIKANDAPEGQRITFTLVGVDLGTNADGETTRAPVVVPVVADRPEPKGSKGPKWPPTLRKALNNVLASGGERTAIPDGPIVLAAERKLVKAEYDTFCPVDDDEADGMADKLRRYFNRDVKIAQGRGLVGVYNLGPKRQMLWIVSKQDEATIRVHIKVATGTGLARAVEATVAGQGLVF